MFARHRTKHISQAGNKRGHLRECVLFIGTRFSNLYTAVDTPAEARVMLCMMCVCFCVNVCSEVLGLLSP